MARLLNANFARLFKGKLFWLCAATSVALGLIEVIPKAIDLMKIGIQPTICMYLIHPANRMSYFGILAITAIFVGIFVGTEHSGVLRNKITAGHRRVSVYMADFLTCLSGVVIFQLLFIATVLLTGIIMGGEFLLPFETIAVYELLQFISLLGVCALFTAITMLIPQKLAGAIAALVLTVGFYFINICVDDALKPLKQEVIVTDEGTGKTKVIDRMNYTDEELSQLVVLTFLKNINPFGQDSIIRKNYENTFIYYEILSDPELSSTETGYWKNPPVPTELIPYSLVTIIFTTSVGAIVFREKNLK